MPQKVRFISWFGSRVFCMQIVALPKLRCQSRATCRYCRPNAFALRPETS